MRLIVGLLACLSLTALSQVRAADPAPQSTPTATQSSAPAATSSSPAPAASAPAVTTSTSTTPPGSAPTPAVDSSAAKADKVTIDDVDRKAMSQGYKVSMMRGEKYYCRTEAIVGSRFDKKVCLTPDQMAATQQRAQDDVSRMQKSMQAAKGG